MVVWSQPGTGKRRNHHVRVAAEVSYRDVHLLILDRSEPKPTVRAYSLTWRKEGASGRQAGALRELTSVLQALVVRERLQGASVHVALSGDFCVTRVLAGTKEEVHRQLRSLRERCALYLSLGSGDNTIAQAVRPLDAKHDVAWVTVANNDRLRAVVNAFEIAGLKVRSIEHSLVTVARMLGKLGYDRDEPALLLDLTQRGVDVGISYQGQLLLDYRPGGLATKEHVAGILVKHLKRLQRFCHRRFRFVTGRLHKVFLCGDAEDVDLVRQQFACQGTLAVNVLDPRQLLAEADCSGADAIQIQHTACATLLLAQSEGVVSSPVPDFMRDWSSQAEEPCWPALIRLCWPIAATLLVALFVTAGAVYQRIRVHQLAQALKEFDGSHQQFRRLQAELSAARLKTEHLARIDRRLFRPSWPALLAALGRSLPQGVWLEKVSVDGEGHVQISGPSRSQDGVFEFVKALKQQPLLTDVALEGTQPAGFLDDSAIRFEITGRLTQLGQGDSMPALIPPAGKIATGTPSGTTGVSGP